MQHFKRFFLLYTLLPLTLLAFGASYYRFMISYDYPVTFEGYCDPYTKSCFEYCEDDDCPDIIEFLTSDKIAVHPDELFLSDAFLEMKTNPLRIELSGNNDQFHEVLWKVA